MNRFLNEIERFNDLNFKDISALTFPESVTIIQMLTLAEEI